MRQILVETGRDFLARRTHLESLPEHGYLVRQRPERHHHHPAAVVWMQPHHVLARHLRLKFDEPEAHFRQVLLRRHPVAENASLRLRAHGLLEGLADLADVAVVGLGLFHLRRRVHERVAGILQRDALYLRDRLHERLVHGHPVVGVASASNHGLNAVRLLSLAERHETAGREN